jgi:hypothetical protein
MDAELLLLSLDVTLPFSQWYQYYKRSHAHRSYASSIRKPRTCERHNVFFLLRAKRVLVLSDFRFPHCCRCSKISPHATTLVPITLILLTLAHPCFNYSPWPGSMRDEWKSGGIDHRNEENDRGRGKCVADVSWDIGAGASLREQIHFHGSCE